MESRQPRLAAVGAPERPPRVDSVVFARRNEALSGSATLSSMPRLLSAGVLAEGGTGTEGSVATGAGPEPATGAGIEPGAGPGAEMSSDGEPGTEGSAGTGAGTDGAAGGGEWLNWEVEGFLGRDEMQRQREFLRVRTRFSPWMTCSRCLAPVQIVDLATDTRFRLAASEAQAAAEDREEESVEVIAADPNLDLAALVEDEAILALPMAPAHASCQWMNTAGPEFPSGL